MAGAFLILVPLVTHVLVSPLGFNPTDDGFTLAYSRRLLEGQIPHRDFIAIRPMLSPALHIPFVLWGGDHTYLVSRFFVWLQFATIAWLWVALTERRLSIQPLGPIEKVSLSLIAFAATAHTFPLMAWHTIDGLLLVSMGLAMVDRSHITCRLSGYTLIGLASLCKQSFVFVAPLSIVIMGDWRKVSCWLAALTPGALYGIFLFLTGSLPDGLQQLTAQTSLLTTGIGAYINVFVLAGSVLGYSGARWTNRGPHLRWLGFGVLAMGPALSLSAALATALWIHELCFGTFGLIVGVVGYHILHPTRAGRGDLSIAGFALVAAWSVSLSLGYNSPALAAGPLLVVLTVYAGRDIVTTPSNQWVRLPVPLVLSMIIVSAFGLARTQHIYREQAASALTYDLSTVLPGGTGLRTNERTYHFLADLQTAIRLAQSLGETYVILPDCPGYWPVAPQHNPLAIDWMQSTELSRPELTDRIQQQLEQLRGANNIIIVQKVEADKLANSFIPLGDDYLVVDYVRQNFEHIAETDLFVLYK